MKLKSWMFIPFICFSCTSLGLSNQIAFEIANKRAGELQKVTFYTSDSLAVFHLPSLGSGKTITGTLDMRSCKSDGDYVLYFRSADGEEIVTDGGYFTNGSPLEKKIHFEVLNDKVTFRTSDY